MKTTHSAHPVHPKIGVIGVQTILAATLVLALAFTFGCEEKSGGKAEDNPKPTAEATTEAAKPAQAKNPAKTVTSQTFTDPRDNKTYKLAKIGEQTWMAENLNYDAKGSKCYDSDPANCQKYGRLYLMEMVCPKGWHLPSDAEWDTLVDFVGGSDVAGSKLKAKEGWAEDGSGTDIYGFSALPGGGYNGGSFYNVGYTGHWWTTSEYSAILAYDQDIYDLNEYPDYDEDDRSSFMFSVRCLQD